MDNENSEFNKWYEEELGMLSSEYPLARIYIVEIKDLLKNTREELYIDPISKMPSNFSEILGMQKPDKFIYFLEDEKEKYKVYYFDEKLCYFIDEKYIPIDSDKVFIDFFGRNYIEDEKYLENCGYPVKEIRKGKAERSCFVLDLDDNLYIFPYRSNTIQHTSLTKGEIIRLAGSIKINSGKISFIDNSTGHYQSHFSLLMKFLDNLYKKTDKTDLSCFFCDNFSSESINLLKHNSIGIYTEELKNQFKRNFLSSIKNMRTHNKIV